jgi:hypothetical protein
VPDELLPEFTEEDLTLLNSQPVEDIDLVLDILDDIFSQREGFFQKFCYLFMVY